MLRRSFPARAFLGALVLTCGILGCAVSTVSTAAADAAVPAYRQQQTNDCEATALRMVLAARGITAGEPEILRRIGVDRVHPLAGVSGSRSGDPYRSFVGDPDGSELAGTGYGVFASRVAEVARSYRLRVLASGEGIGTADLYRQVAAGHPAIVWVDYLWRRMPQHYYTAYDGVRVQYEGPAEHAVVLVAVRDREVEVNDPARGVRWVSKQAFAAGYGTYHSMAVVVA